MLDQVDREESDLDVSQISTGWAAQSWGLPQCCTHGTGVSLETLHTFVISLITDVADAQCFPPCPLFHYMDSSAEA